MPGNVLAGPQPFVNVKADYDAKGDGLTNDAVAIQNALDSLSETGGIIFFPHGTYLLTSNILFYSNQTLWFETGATLLQGNASMTNLMMAKCATGTEGYNGTHDCLIHGAVFDGGSYETNNTLVGICHCKNITFENCTFKNAYGAWHDLEINSSYNSKVIDCDFEGARKNSSNACLIQIDSMDTSATWPWDGNRGAVDNTVSMFTEICGSIFHNDTISPAVGNHSSTSIKYLRIHDCVFVGLTSERAVVGFQSSKYVDIYDNTFVDCASIINDRSGSSWTLHDNRIDGETTVSGFASQYKNLINGTLTN